ncbi:acyl-CoA thioesterase [Thiotrichales bacterium 19S3-7]|nr:acyl-CoA thioesterase [Thiotrichales bacterium 19S3-7]MCF6800750.1 acyl-CoA thioesterase [Thiotrichales bacterium 19S3-11]
MQRIDFQVQPHDVDGQGIVNNVRYYAYLDRARIHFLETVLRIDFVAWSQEGKNLILADANLSFKQSLRLNDRFYILTRPIVDGPIKILIEQRIYHDNGSLIVKANLTATCVEVYLGKRRFFVPEAFKSYQKEEAVV